MLGEHGLTPLTDHRQAEALQIETIQSVTGIKPPAASVAMHYTAKIRSESLARFGAYSMGDWFRKVFRKKPADPIKKRRKALQHGLARMKEETEHSMRSHFIDFGKPSNFSIYSNSSMLQPIWFMNNSWPSSMHIKPIWALFPK